MDWLFNALGGYGIIAAGVMWAVGRAQQYYKVSRYAKYMADNKIDGSEIAQEVAHWTNQFPWLGKIFGKK